MLNKITASLICMDLSDIKTDIDTLLDNGINHFHADFMDNTFVPRLGISPELIQWIKNRYGDNVSIDSHLMVKDPISCLDVIAPYSDWVFFHYEATTDPVRVLQVINKHDVNRGVAYNLGSHFHSYLQDTGLVDGIMFMGISPGVLGAKSWPDLLIRKIYELRLKVGYDKTTVFLDGGISFSSIKELVSDKKSLFGDLAGADFVVCGGSTLFKIDNETELMDREEMIKFNIERIKEALK